MIYHAIFHGRMLQIIRRSALAQKNMSPQFNFIKMTNTCNIARSSVTLRMTWISTQSARQCLNCHEGWRMTKNMKTTKHNKKEASEAKKEHPKKGISPRQRNSFRVSPLCHSENLIVCNFQIHPPTQKVKMTFCMAIWIWRSPLTLSLKNTNFVSLWGGFQL